MNSSKSGASSAKMENAGGISRFSQTERTERNGTRSRFDEPKERYESTATGSHSGQPQSQTRATSRLQAMRDARRPTHVDSSFDERDMAPKETRERGSPPDVRRVGLPRGPKQRF